MTRKHRKIYIDLHWLFISALVGLTAVAFWIGWPPQVRQFLSPALQHVHQASVSINLRGFIPVMWAKQDPPDPNIWVRRTEMEQALADQRRELLSAVEQRPMAATRAGPSPTPPAISDQELRERLLKGH